jgi:hypothetical protein
MPVDWSRLMCLNFGQKPALPGHFRGKWKTARKGRS